MTARPKLRRRIADIWRKCIEGDYCAQRINSERSLQASVWAELNTAFLSKSWRLFIEPSITDCESGMMKIPDLVVCNSSKIVAFIELKYQPRQCPSWAKDLGTLHWLATRSPELTLTNGRFRGVTRDERIFGVADNALLVWAGIHAADPTDLREHVAPELLSQFMGLHAETQQGAKPSLRIY